MLVSRIYLGRNIPPDPNQEIHPGPVTFPQVLEAKPGRPRLVTDPEIQKFLEEDVSRFFPGFTAYQAVGYWKREQEKTTVLEVIHDRGTDRVKIQEIAGIYRRRFHQESVLVTTQTADVAFVEG
jgi:hypothetical protein